MYESAFSLPRLTAAIISRALNLEQGGRLRIVRLPDSLDADLLNTCLFMNKGVFPSICELEPGECDDIDGPAPVLIDATGYHRNSHEKEIRSCEAVINDLEPGYLGFCDWDPFVWCLYALALSGRSKAAVLLPASLIDKAEQARTILMREGLIERVVYFPHSEPSRYKMCELIVLSTENRNVTFHNASDFTRYMTPTPANEESCPPLAIVPDWSHVVVGPHQTSPIETIVLETRELLQHHAPLSWGKINLIAITRNYSATLGDSFTRVAPFMPRESTTSNDIGAVEVRRISSQDFQDGNLLPADAVESANGSDSKYVKVDPSVLDRYELRAGDIVMPRMLGRYGASNLLVVSDDDAKQHLVASHNTTVIRPSFQTMTEEERVVFSEIIVGYLTEGHGAQLIQALSEVASIRAIRPSDLFEIEVPPALDPRTREYSESINRFAEVVKAKKQAEDAVAQAQRNLEAAKKAVTQVVDQASK